jgi:hypothetical protein
LYKSKLKYNSVLAICFAETTGETYHHWKVFSSGLSGVCIEFEKDKLLEYFDNRFFKKGTVEYLTIREFETTNINIHQLPFLKRSAFRDENEFRIIYKNKNEKMTSRNVDIELDSISRIIFNPWIPQSVSDSVKMVINKIDSCKDIKIQRSSLIENEKWKEIAQKKVSPMRIFYNRKP